MNAPGAALLAAALLVATGRAPPQGEYEAKSREARTAAAAPLVRYGGWCTGRSYHAAAREHFRLALRFLPDEPTARAKLGFRRAADGSWTPPAKAIATPDSSPKSVPAGLSLEQERRKALAEAAAPFAALAAWCGEARLDGEEEEAWRTVLSLDPGNAAARKALGLEGLDAGWVLPAGSGPGACRARVARVAEDVRAKLPPPVSFLEDTPWRRAFGGEASQFRAGRFQVETVFPRALAEDLARKAAESEALLRALGLLDPGGARLGKRYSFAVLESEEHYEALVRWAHPEDDRKRRYLLGLSGFYLDRSTYVDKTSPTRAVDAVVHKAAEFLVADEYDSKRAGDWFEESCAYLCSTTLAGSATSTCVSLSTSGTERDGLPGDVASWDAVVREGVARGDDVPLPELLRLDTNDFSVGAVLKGWSLLTWSLSGSPRPLVRFLRALEAKRTPDEAALESFGCPLETVDREWRAWARRP